MVSESILNLLSFLQWFWYLFTKESLGSHWLLSCWRMISKGLSYIHSPFSFLKWLRSKLLSQNKINYLFNILFFIIKIFTFLWHYYLYFISFICIITFIRFPLLICIYHLLLFFISFLISKVIFNFKGLGSGFNHGRLYFKGLGIQSINTWLPICKSIFGTFSIHFSISLYSLFHGSLNQYSQDLFSYKLSVSWLMDNQTVPCNQQTYHFLFIII